MLGTDTWKDGFISEMRGAREESSYFKILLVLLAK
jgi:hypothetical protein